MYVGLIVKSPARKPALLRHYKYVKASSEGGSSISFFAGLEVSMRYATKNFIHERNPGPLVMVAEDLNQV